MGVNVCVYASAHKFRSCYVCNGAMPLKFASMLRQESKFEVHKLLNMKMEEESMRFNGRDPYQLITVDTHCHLASSMVYVCLFVEVGRAKQ